MFDLDPDEVMDARFAFARYIGGREVRALIVATDVVDQRTAIALRMRQRTVADLIGEAGRIYGLMPHEIVSRARGSLFVRARQWVMYNAILEVRCILPDIARRLGVADHSTVIHGARVHAVRHGLAHVSEPQTDGKRRRLAAVIFEGPEPGLEHPWDPATRRDARIESGRRNIEIARASQMAERRARLRQML